MRGNRELRILIAGVVLGVGLTVICTKLVLTPAPTPTGALSCNALVAAKQELITVLQEEVKKRDSRP